MSSPRDQDMDEEFKRGNALAAAEYSLGLLEGEELLAARGRLANDDGFAWRKVWWDNWFAPLTDQMPAAEPGPQVWERIAAEIDLRPADAMPADAIVAANDGAHSNVVDISARLRRWQWTAGLTGAAAAVLAAVAFVGQGTGPAPVPTATDAPQFAAADPLVAQVPIGDTGLRLDVTYIPETDRLLVGAIGLTADGVHDHELWLVPEDGSALQSLGVVAPGEVRSFELPAEIVSNMGSGVELVLTREPIGGKPEGEDAGPVVAEGTLTTV
ncbi:anti-sigma factor domain-containing protein [Erythrobacter sp. KY5]|uniref:anti-sigma factor n=1 Tax=Erythrobacter sp. KY5 TaxID=2011159 RepID=UPI001F19E9CB|nr:anti-sigma factor [Erythrobacter sp. KY5]